MYSGYYDIFKCQAPFDTKEQGGSHKEEKTNDNPGARSTKNDKREHGAEEISKKEHEERKKS